MSGVLVFVAALIAGLTISFANSVDGNLIGISNKLAPQQEPDLSAFISYRRDGSRNLAMLLKVRLEMRNVTVFLDVDAPEGQLSRDIADAPNFILVLSYGTLDGVQGDDTYLDPLHKEIREAVCTDKRIIPVFDDYNFQSTADFSEEINIALANQGQSWNHALVDQCLKRIMSYMITSSELSEKSPSGSVRAC